MALPLALLLLLQAPSTLPTQLAAAQDTLKAGAVDAAIDLAQHYVWKNPRDPNGFLELGDAWAAKKPMGGLQALQNYRAARDLEPKDPDPPYRMAQLALRLGGADGERILQESLERVMALDPLYKNAWWEWLLTYRNAGGRADMIKRLRPFAADPTVKARLAQLEIENESYGAADSLLAGAIAADSADPEWLALRAQSALETGDTLIGFAVYQHALDHADRDTTNQLWRQIVGITTPAEYVAWMRGVPPAERGAWIESFWARRNPDLFAGANLRILEHFERLRYARKHFPLLHPLTLYERNAASRGMGELMTDRERAFHVNCEVYQGITNGSTMDLTPRWLTAPFMDAGGALGWKDDTPLATGSVTELASVFDNGVFAPLNLDLRSVDTIAARVGYNLETGLDDRGVMYLRFGPPNHVRVGGDNVGCFNPEVERWQYPGFGEVRFDRPSAFGGTIPEVVFRPMNPAQYALMVTGLTRDASAVAAPLQFGVWFAQFRDSLAPRLSDLVVVSTRGELAATVVGAVGGDRGVHASESGVVTIHDRPGAYALLTDARVADTLGRQSFGATLRAWDSLPAMSDLLMAVAWPDSAASRGSMLAHLQRDLVYPVGVVVRSYAEIYGLTPSGGTIAYHATYQLLRTGNVARDLARPDWPDAVNFDFDRRLTLAGAAYVPEVLDIDPNRIPAGRYLLRLVVRDLGGVNVGRATIAFEVR